MCKKERYEKKLNLEWLNFFFLIIFYNYKDGHDEGQMSKMLLYKNIKIIPELKL